MDLSRVLLITTKKGVWASEECRIFPNILFTQKIVNFRHSTHWVNSFPLFIRTIIWIWRYHPRLVVVGSAVTVGLWLERMKRWGWIKCKLLVHNRHYQSIEAGEIDGVIHDTTAERDFFEKRDPSTKHFFVPYCMEYWKSIPANAKLPDSVNDSFFLSTGSAGRDYSALIGAAKGSGVRGVVTAQTRDSVNLPDSALKNIQVFCNLPEEEFWGLLKRCKFVVVCLRKDFLHMGGGSTVLKALQCGKPVITDPYHGDYVKHGRSGLLVDSCDEKKLRDAIQTLWGDEQLCADMATYADEDGRKFNYETFCSQLLMPIECLLSS